MSFFVDVVDVLNLAHRVQNGRVIAPPNSSSIARQARLCQLLDQVQGSDRQLAQRAGGKIEGGSTTERANRFGDLTVFESAKPKATAPNPTEKAVIDQVAAENNFPSRQATKPAAQPTPRQQRRRRHIVQQSAAANASSV